MAVAVMRTSRLMGHIKYGKNYSQDSRDVNSYEHIMENHVSPSLLVLHKRAAFGIEEVNSVLTPFRTASPLFD